jgi:tetratricopeptide (TPR) repeat protein
MMRIAIAALLVILAMRSARADDLERAKALYDEGLRNYNLTDYAPAIVAWKEAYRLSKRPLLLFNIGQAYRLAGDCVEALKFYDSYRREESKPKPELDPAIAECANKPPPDPEKQAEAPPVVLQPPPPIEFGPIPRLVGEPADRRKRIAGLIVGSLGVAAGGGAVWFAVDSAKQSDELDNYTGPWGDKQIASERRGKRDVKLAYGFGAAGVASVVVGGILIWLGRDRREIEIDIAPMRGGTGASWTVTF